MAARSKVFVVNVGVDAEANAASCWLVVVARGQRSNAIMGHSRRRGRRVGDDASSSQDEKSGRRKKDRMGGAYPRLYLVVVGRVQKRSGAFFRAETCG